MKGELAGDYGLEREIGFCGEIADEHDGAPAADGGEREIQRGRDPDDFERDISAESAGELRNCSGNVATIGTQRIRGPELAGECEAVVREIDGDDARRAGPAQRLNDAEPDHAGPDDDRCGIGRKAHALDGVNCDGDGLDHGGLWIRQAIGERVQDARGYGEKFGERTVLSVFDGSDAHDAAMIAQINFAARAERTRAAGNRRIKGHAMARTPALDARTDGDDFARGLVAHDERRPPSAGRAIPTVDITAADAAGVDAQQHLISRGDGRGKIRKFELGRSGEDERFHGGGGGEGGGERGGVNASELGGPRPGADPKNQRRSILKKSHTPRLRKTALGNQNSRSG